MVDNVNTPVTAKSNDWWRRVVRTFIQLLISGAFFGLTNELANDIDPQYTPYILGLYTIIVAGAQNLAEDMGVIPAVLKGKASSGKEPLPETENNAPLG